MTPKQAKRIERIRKNFFNRSAGSDLEGWEFKKNEVSEQDGLVFLYLVAGMKNDEGTMAQTFVRTRGHFMIKKRGGVVVLGHIENGLMSVQRKYQNQYYK